MFRHDGDLPGGICAGSYRTVADDAIKWPNSEEVSEGATHELKPQRNPALRCTDWLAIMSLDVYLTTPHLISRDEWDERNPGHEPCVAVSTEETNDVYSANITHNLGAMAEEAGIYKHLWRPEEIGITKAGQLVEPLRAGMALLKADPPRFEKHNAKNGWGLYEHFVPWVANYLAACQENPTADVRVSR